MAESSLGKMKKRMERKEQVRRRRRTDDDSSERGRKTKYCARASHCCLLVYFTCFQTLEIFLCFHLLGFEPYDPEFECGGTGPDRQCPFETKERDIKDNPGMGLQGLGGRLLHVGIASYRDPLCPKTLYNMFTKSKHPEKLRVRVIQQNGESRFIILKK